VWIDEDTPGRERAKIVLKKLVPSVVQADFGDPATGTTRYDVCLYDDALRPVGALAIDRAGEACGTRSCWHAVSTKGYRYVDRAATAAGVRSIVASGGSAGHGKLVLKARNDERLGQLAMPRGMAAALASSRSVTVQALTSDGACFGATLTAVRSSGPTNVRAE
jgi:hypothetical protein